jgi:hypothetical protein
VVYVKWLDALESPFEAILERLLEPPTAILLVVSVRKVLRPSSLRLSATGAFRRHQARATLLTPILGRVQHFGGFFLHEPTKLGSVYLFLVVFVRSRLVVVRFHRSR